VKRILNWREYIKENWKWELDDVEDLFQDFKDNYYELTIKESNLDEDGIMYSNIHRELVYPFPGHYISDIMIDIASSSSKNSGSERFEDPIIPTFDILTEKFQQIIQQLEAYGFKLRKAYPSNLENLVFKNGKIFDGGKFKSGISLYLITDEIKEYSIQEYLLDKRIDLSLDYQEGSVGFSFFNYKEVMELIDLFNSKPIQNILEFIKDIQTPDIIWSYLTEGKEDYYYEIGDWINDYYSDFETLTRNSIRLKSDRKMGIDEMIIYLEENYPDLLSEIEKFLVTKKRELIQEYCGKWLKSILESYLRVELVEGGVRIYFPNSDWIKYNPESIFVEKFDNLLYNKNNIFVGGDSKNWKDFIKTLIFSNIFNYNFKNSNWWMENVDFHFQYPIYTEIENMIHHYEN